MNDHYTENFDGIILSNGAKLPFKVLESAAGFYIGTWCEGSYSRESAYYYRTQEEAKHALDTGRWLPKI